MYQVTRGEEEGGATERTVSSPLRAPQAQPESGVEGCLSSIDHNLNTFTTQQFEELRDKVKQLGFYKAQIVAQQQFGLKQPKTKLKNLTLSFISEDKKEESNLQEYQAQLIGPDAELNRKLILRSENEEQSILCTGFLSCPNILFDPYGS